jgi:hypothetical protein
MTSRLKRAAQVVVPLAALFVAATVTAVAGWVAGFIVVLILLLALEEWTRTRTPQVRRALEQVRLGVAARSVVRCGLLLVLAARSPVEPRWMLPVLVLGVVAVQVLRGAAQVSNRALRARSVWPVAWRNMEVPDLDLPADGRWSGRLRAARPRVVDGLELVMAAALLAATLGAAPAWPVTIALAALLTGVGVVVTLRRRTSSLPPRDRADVLAAVRNALESIGPRVVVYFGGPPSSTHALNVWVPVLEQLDVPVLVLVRQRVHLRRLASERLPAVWLPRATDVESAVVPSLGLALYPTNIAQNNHLIRVPGITDVFIGHGDSDKGGSSTPLSRIYDEVWVAGPAGRDRYRLADVGVRDEQIREVGRPQLAEIARGVQSTGRTGRRPFTVLYAPTWEGFYESWSYSSLLHMGERIVSRLVAMDGVTVLVKPHPASGSVNKAYGRAAKAVTAAVRAAGGPHRVIDGVTGLYEAFNEADLLVTDVSSVVTDFLWSRKPYVMTNPAGLPDDEYRRQFPSSAGAPLWERDLATLEGDIEDARTVDRYAGRREAVARYLLGDEGTDPQERFADAVTDILRLGPQGRGSRSVADGNVARNGTGPTSGRDTSACLPARR